MSVADVISLVLGIHRACVDVGARAAKTKKVLRVTGEKLRTTKPLLELLERTQDASKLEDMVRMLCDNLKSLSKIVNQAKELKPILYMVKAPSIQEELEQEMGNLQFTLVGAVSVHEAKEMKDALQNFLDKWQKQENRLVALRDQEKLERSNLVEGDVQANILQFTGNSKKELQTLVETMKAEQKALQQKLKTTKDDNLQRRLAEETDYLRKMVAALEMVEEEQKQHKPTNLLQEEGKDWVYCPLSKEVMTDPVTVDCKCQHAFSRASIKEWLDRGNTTCPTCKMRLQSSNISSSPQLQQAIEERISYDLPGAPVECGTAQRRNSYQPRCCRWLVRAWRNCRPRIQA